MMNRLLNNDLKQATTGLTSSQMQFTYFTTNIPMLYLNINMVTTGVSSRHRIHVPIPRIINPCCLNIHAIMTEIISRQCHVSSICSFKPSI